MPRGFHLLIAAQFLSALADNALLIVMLAWLQAQGMAPWLAPLLKVGFIAAYVLLAPVVGPLADTWPKQRLMGWMNALKAAGAAALLWGLHPLLAFALVGLGAAAYAPAKYGLVTETVPAERLVAANGWIEVTVVAAVLLGTGLGGALVSTLWLQSATAQWLAQWGPGLPLAASVFVLLALYAASAVLNRGIPGSGLRYPRTAWQPQVLLPAFWRDQRRLWRDHEGGLSLAATSVFWGTGATLQFMVLRWAQETLALPLSQAALLQGVVAVGVVVGATAAGRWVPLSGARHLLWAGVLMGLALPSILWVHSLAAAVPLLVAVGAVGGLMVVPLNALLQHRGAQLLSAGRSIAVQGFNENASVLLALGAYSATVAGGWPLAWVLVGLGGGLAAVLTLLARRAARPAPAAAAVASPAAAQPRSAG